MTASLAPAAKIVAGLQSESLSSRMQSALKGVEDVTSWTARRLAYSREGIDWRNFHAETFRASDAAAMWAELSERQGVDA